MQKVITDFSTGKKSTFAEPDRRGHHPENGTAEANRTRHKGDIKNGTGGRFLELTPHFLCPLYFQNIWQTGKTPGILRGNTDRNSPPSISTHPGVKRCRAWRKLQGRERLNTEADTLLSELTPRSGFRNKAPENTRGNQGRSCEQGRTTGRAAGAEAARH